MIRLPLCGAGKRSFSFYETKTKKPLTAEERECLELTKQKIARWQSSVAKAQAEDLAALTERLFAANQLTAHRSIASPSDP